MVTAMFVMMCLAYSFGVMGTLFKRKCREESAIAAYEIAQSINLVAIIVVITYWCLGN